MYFYCCKWTEINSYFWVWRALKAASVAPLPPPPTASSAARLQQRNEKTICVTTCFHMDLALQDNQAKYFHMCLYSAPSPPPSLAAHVFPIPTMGQIMHKAVWISELDFNGNATTRMLCKTSAESYQMDLLCRPPPDIIITWASCSELYITTGR